MFWFPVFLVLFEACVYASTDMYIPGITMLMKEFAISQELAQFTLSFFFLAEGLLSLIAGPLSDRFGRKLILVFGAFIFLVASLLCSLAPNIYLFLIGRCLQGSAVGFIPVGYAAIHESYTSKKAVKIVAIMGAAVLLSVALSPVIGAFIIEITSWRAIFWISLVASIVSIAGLIWFMRETATQHSSSILKVLIGYKSLLLNKNFMFFTFISTACLATFFAWAITAPFIIVQQLGKSTLYFGIVQSFVCGSLVVGNLLTRYLVTRRSVAQLVKLSVLTFCGGSAAMILASIIKPSCIALISICMFVASTGAAMLFAPIGRLTVEASLELMGSKMALSAGVINNLAAFVIICMTALKIRTFLGLSFVVASMALSVTLLYLMLEKRGAIKFVSND